MVWIFFFAVGCGGVEGGGLWFCIWEFGLMGLFFGAVQFSFGLGHVYVFVLLFIIVGRRRVLFLRPGFIIMIQSFKNLVPPMFLKSFDLIIAQTIFQLLGRGSASHLYCQSVASMPQRDYRSLVVVSYSLLWRRLDSHESGSGFEAEVPRM